MDVKDLAANVFKHSCVLEPLNEKLAFRERNQHCWCATLPCHERCAKQVGQTVSSLSS